MIETIWRDIESAQTGEQLLTAIKSTVLDSAYEHSGSSIFYKIGKNISEKIDNNEALQVLENLWDNGGRAGKLIGVELISRKADDPGTYMFVIYRLAQTCDFPEVSLRLGKKVLGRFVKEDPESYSELLDQWAEENNEWLKKVAQYAR